MLKVYGSRISYFTGKLEAYLRFRRIKYERIPSAKHVSNIREQVGSMQMPVVELDDGRWMSDTTPMIQFLESEYPGPTVIPENPLQRFISLLIEDYADEWLWRPAMHYRWSFEHDRELLSSIIVDELMQHIVLPRFMKRRLIQRRQTGRFVVGDGVTTITRGHVEDTYKNALVLMSSIFSKRPFMFGQCPTLADISLMGPMLRHFGQDPTPVEIMRTYAPSVYAWVGRVWNSHEGNTSDDLEEGLPYDLIPLLEEIGETHLVQLDANSDAYAENRQQFNMVVQGQVYTGLPVSLYRVWCLEKLQQAHSALELEDQMQLREMMSSSAISILSSPKIIKSGYDIEDQAPFNKAINVFG